MRIWGDDTKDHPFTRIESIAKALRSIYPNSFKYLDLCCGEGDVIIELARVFTDSQFFGLDMTKYPEWEYAPRNITFKCMYLQDYIKYSMDQMDVVSLLNTHRNWPEEMKQVKEDLYKWLPTHCMYFITSITNKDIKVPFNYGFIGTDTASYPLILCKMR